MPQDPGTDGGGPKVFEAGGGAVVPAGGGGAVVPVGDDGAEGEVGDGVADGDGAGSPPEQAETAKRQAASNGHHVRVGVDRDTALPLSGVDRHILA